MPPSCGTLFDATLKDVDLSPLAKAWDSFWKLIQPLLVEHAFLTIICAFFALMMTLSFYRFLKGINPGLVAFILILIFGMLAISIAMRSSGLDRMLAVELAELGRGQSPWLMLSLVILITSIATEVLSNNAIAVLFTPVVIGLAQQMGVDPRPFVVGVMFAASCSFATPIGYQTNTLVYGAGNYRFGDFSRLGIPMNIISWLLFSALIPLFWPFQP